MWVFIWICFAVFIFGFVGWTLLVLFQQKKTWSGYAKKHDLSYTPNRMMESPVVTGNLDERIFSLYTGVQQTDDIRGQRYVTVIEFQMGKGMPTGAAISTKEFSGFINGLIFNEVLTPELAEWDNSYVVRSRDKKNLKVYLTKERQQILQSLFSMKGAAVLFFFDEIEAVLRIETSDPLRNMAHLEKIIKRIQSAVDVLIPSTAEKKQFKKLLAEEKEREEKGYDEGDDEDHDEEEAVNDEASKEDDEDAEKESAKKKGTKKAQKKSAKKS